MEWNVFLLSRPLQPTSPYCLQVASQCLQSAYALTSEDKHLEVSRPLENIFQDATKSEPVRS